MMTSEWTKDQWDAYEAYRARLNAWKEENPGLAKAGGQLHGSHDSAAGMTLENEPPPTTPPTKGSESAEHEPVDEEKPKRGKRASDTE